MEENNIAMVETEALIEGEVYAKIIKKDDGYHVVDFDGTEGPVCKVMPDGLAIALTPNKAKRQWAFLKKLEAKIEKDGYMELTYKAKRTLNREGGPKLPNAKLIAYLSEEDQAEYKAIIERAQAAKAEDKKKPLTDKEKLEAKIAKLRAELEAMGADVE